MSETLITTPELLVAGLEEERQADIELSEELFTRILKKSIPVAGRVRLHDRSLVDVAQKHRPEGSVAMVINHEYIEPEISEAGELIDRPMATKYVIDWSGDTGSDFSDTVIEKTYDLTKERQLARERFNLDDEDAIDEFIKSFVDKELGRSAHREKLWQIDQALAELRRKRDQDLPPKPENVTAAQLVTAQHLKELLQQVMEVLPNQVARAQVAREYDE